MPDKPNPATDTEVAPLLTYAQVEAELGVPRGTLFYWVSTQQIPHVRLGPRTVRFRRDDLVRWLGQRTVGVAREQ